MTIEFSAIEFDKAWEATQHIDASGRGKAILLDGKPMVVSQEDADRIAAAGIEFAYLCDHEMPDGSYRIMTVPVN